jgi:hypothetical protein
MGIPPGLERGMFAENQVLGIGYQVSGIGYRDWLVVLCGLYHGVVTGAWWRCYRLDTWRYRSETPVYAATAAGATITVLKIEADALLPSQQIVERLAMALSVSLEERASLDIVILVTCPDFRCKATVS